MSSDKKYRVKTKHHQALQEQVLLDSVEDLSAVRKRLEEVGVDSETIVNLFSQAYVVVGMRHEVSPQDLLQLVTLNGLGLGIMNQNPDMSPDDLAAAVETEINGQPGDEPLFDRSSPDPEMPLFLMPGLGEA